MKITINSAGLQDWSGSVLLIGLTEGDFNQQLNDLGQLANKELLLDHLKKIIF